VSVTFTEYAIGVVCFAAGVAYWWMWVRRNEQPCMPAASSQGCIVSTPDSPITEFSDFTSFMILYIRRFRTEHPEISVRLPSDGTDSKLFEVTDAHGVLTVYERAHEMVADLQDMFGDTGMGGFGD
jgi:hypothetical protein